MQNKFGLKILVISIALVIVASSVAMYSATDMEKGIDGNGGNSVISLEVPSFFSIASAGGGGGGAVSTQEGTAFLEDEAGVSAYVNTSQSIDLNKAELCYRNIEYNCSDYIIGSVELPDLPEDEDVHVYVSADGWIVAYYLKDEPAGKIMQWIGYNGSEINTTKLEDAISKMCTCVEIPYQQIKSDTNYYDFKYPDANRLMIIVDRMDVYGTDKFEFKIPGEYEVYNASWSHYAYDSYGSNTKIKKTFDDEWTDVNSFGATADNGWFAKHGYYDGIETDDFYTVSIFHDDRYIGSNYQNYVYYYGYACVATTFVYREP
jgi:hypothetical protein